ncbi:MAG: universal stress protein, partial [Planctomycetota bacterium]
HYSQPGDWAFDYALNLSQKHSLQLNVFHFLADPYSGEGNAYQNLPKKELEQIAIERERELRIYYDQRAGDYLDVGFRLCYDDSWRELHRCLLIHEFQLLVLGYTAKDAIFARKPIERFAASFVCPVVLVGPENANQYRLNSQAALLIEKLELEDKPYHRIGDSSPDCTVR